MTRPLHTDMPFSEGSNPEMADGPSLDDPGDVPVERAATFPFSVPGGLFDVLRRRWVTVAAITLLGAILGFAFGTSQLVKYESRARIVVGPYSAEFDTLRAASGLVHTYADLVTSDVLLSSVSANLGFADVRNQVIDITASANDVTRVLTITVVAPSSELASNVANEAAQTLASFAVPDVTGVGTINIIDVASPDRAIGQDPTNLTTLLGILAGLAGGLGAALVLEKSRTTVYSTSDVVSASSLPVLGEARWGWRWGLGRVEHVDGLKPTIAGIVHDPFGPPLKLALVPSETRGQVGAVARSLSSVITDTGRSVLLLTSQGDTRSGAQTPTMSDVLSRGSSVRTRSRLSDGEGVSVAVDLTGAMSINPRAARDSLTLLARAASVTILDLTSVRDSPASSVLATHAADVVIVYIVINRSTRGRLEDTLRSLDGSRDRIAGLLLIRPTMARRVMEPITSKVRSAVHRLRRLWL